MKDKSSPERGGGDVRANCWTCRHDGIGPLGCGAMGRTGLRVENRYERRRRELIDNWIDREVIGGPESDKHGWAMPREDANGCPGWVRR